MMHPSQQPSAAPGRFRATSSRRLRKTVLLSAMAGLLVSAVLPATGMAARPGNGGGGGGGSTGTAHYPDLKTKPPENLAFDVVNGQLVLRFDNTAWNAGKGALHLSASTVGKAEKKSRVHQYIYDAPTSAGNIVEKKLVGEFVFHQGHNHFHFEDFAHYQLWTAQAWADRSNGSTAVLKTGSKTTFCIMDYYQEDGSLTGSPSTAQYSVCGRTTQGMSVGWGDTYKAHLEDQWVVLGGELADGNYVLQSVADPKNLLKESGTGSGESESEADNQGVTCFTVSTVNGQKTITNVAACS